MAYVSQAVDIRRLHGMVNSWVPVFAGKGTRLVINCCVVLNFQRASKPQILKRSASVDASGWNTISSIQPCSDQLW